MQTTEESRLLPHLLMASAQSYPAHILTAAQPTFDAFADRFPSPNAAFGEGRTAQTPGTAALTADAAERVYPPQRSSPAASIPPTIRRRTEEGAVSRTAPGAAAKTDATRTRTAAATSVQTDAGTADDAQTGYDAQTDWKASARGDTDAGWDTVTVRQGYDAQSGLYAEHEEDSPARFPYASEQASRTEDLFRLPEEATREEFLEELTADIRAALWGPTRVVD